MKRVAIFGMGYVGCVTAACLARDGHQVVGVDISAEKIEELRAGVPTVLEPGLDELIASAVQSGHLTATTDVKQAVADTDLALIAVGTPSREDGGVSYAAVVSVVRDIVQQLAAAPKPYGVCVRSTLLPGVLEERVAGELRELGEKHDVWIGNNPEFLREGSAIKDYDAPPYVVVGADDPTNAQAVLELYRGVDAPQIVTDTRSASLIKYACNAFHAVKVAFANEIGALSKSLGANGHEVMRIVCEDDKLNISKAYMRPGLPFGGSCLPKDLRALIRYASETAEDVDLLEATLASNENQLRRCVSAVLRENEKNIGIVGLSFKTGTDDLRESPAVLLCEALLGKGFNIKILDPNVAVSRVRGQNLAYIDRHLPHLAALMAESREELLAHADLLIFTNGVADDLKEATTCKQLDLRTALARSRT